MSEPWAVRDHWAALVETVREPMVVLDRELRVCKANKAFYQSFHLNAVESEERLVYSLTGAVWKTPRFRTLLEELLTRQTRLVDVAIESEFPPEGRKTILINATRVVDGEGKPTLLLAFEVRSALLPLREEEVLPPHGMVAANMGEGVAVVRTSDGIIVYTNQRFDTMFGYERGELLGKPVSILNDSTDRPPEETAQEIIAALRTHGVWRGTVLNVRKEGTAFWCRASVSTFEHREHGTVWVACQTDISDLKKAEAALQESEHRLRLVLDALPAGAYTCDRDGLITYFNDRARQLWGRSPKLNHPDDRYCGSFKLFRPTGEPLRHEDSFMALAVREGVSTSGAEVIMERPDGSRRLVLAHATSLRDPSDQVIGGVNVLVDITERKQAIDAMRESQQRFQELAEGLPQLVWTCRPDGSCDYGNPQIQEYTGVLLKEVLGFGWRENVHPDDRAECDRKITEAAATGQGFQFVQRLRRHDGVYRWFTTRGAPIHDAQGKIVKWVGTSTDIDDQVQISEALHASQERLRAVVSTAVEAIITIDDQGGIDSVNPAAERMFGYSASELVGRNVNLLMPSPYREEHDYYLKRYLRTGERRLIGGGREVQGRRRDGSTFPLDLSVSEFWDQSRRMFTGVIRDVSKRKALEREVLEIATEEQRRIGQALHDSTGQELTALSLLVETLRDMLEGSVAAPLVIKVREGVQRALSQVRAHAQGLIPVEVDSRGLSAALAELTARTNILQGVECTFESSGPVLCDAKSVATQLFYIAKEAVGNALRHGQPRHIGISLNADRSVLTLRIVDDGIGFAPETVSGAGMGLKIMHYRAGLINGRLVVEKAVPRGTAVICTVHTSTTHDHAHESRGADSDR